MKVSGWGKYPVVDGELITPQNHQELIETLKNQKSVISRGNGRSYGDASLYNTMVSTLALNSIISLERDRMEITCEAGILLSDVLEYIVPKGFFLPVTPGTKYITLGGAIAADVHGKNHHQDGCFSQYVVNMKVLMSDGEVVNCNKSQNSDIFHMTCGGMGLTGIITEATIRLLPVETSFIHQDNIPFQSIEELVDLFQTHEADKYTVAWTDTININNQNLISGILMIGKHASLGSVKSLVKNAEQLCVPKKFKINIPFEMPSFVINKVLIGLYNRYYYWKSLRNRKLITHYESFFYPLDGILNWNRLYGKNGFTQYQVVIPKEHIIVAWYEFINLMKRHGQYSMLTVLKMFGGSNVHAPMSFPLEGLSMAFDFKVNNKLLNMLNEMDAVVERFGGRNYLAKDSRMTPEVFKNMYHVEAFRKFKSRFDVDKKFDSLQSKRLKIISNG